MTNCDSNVSEYRQPSVGKSLLIKIKGIFVMTYSLRVILYLKIKTKVATNSIGPIPEKSKSKVTHVIGYNEINTCLPSKTFKL